MHSYTKNKHVQTVQKPQIKDSRTVGFRHRNIFQYIVPNIATHIHIMCIYIRIIFFNDIVHPSSYETI